MQLSLAMPRALASIARTTVGLTDLARTTVGVAVESAAAAATVPVRLVRVLGAVELLVNRITVTTDRADALLVRTGDVVAEAEETARRARLVAAAAALAVEEATTVAAGAAATAKTAGAVADQVADTAARADNLLTAYEPTLRQAAPMARHFVEQLTPAEVTAAIRLFDDLPRLREHLTTDVLPLLGTLERVGPDVHALLEVTRDLKLAVTGIPGFRMLRRRGEDRIADDETA